MQDIEELHHTACAREEAYYIDPESGYRVFTAFHLLGRGRCCSCGCRHCPYRKAANRVCEHWSRVLCGNLDHVREEVDLMFFSGGKDSYLAMRRLLKERVRDVVLVTTYDGGNGVVAHQNVAVEEVKRQAQILGMVLVGVALGSEGFVKDVERLVERLKDHGVEAKRLVFGDLHLTHIREWRERMLAPLGELYFPLWGVEYDTLLEELEEEGVVVRISAVEGVKGVTVGDVFDRRFAKALPAGVDRFGETGEFHTLVCLWEEAVWLHRSWEIQ